MENSTNNILDPDNGDYPSDSDSDESEENLSEDERSYIDEAYTVLTYGSYLWSTYKIVRKATSPIESAKQVGKMLFLPAVNVLSRATGIDAFSTIANTTIETLDLLTAPDIYLIQKATNYASKRIAKYTSENVIDKLKIKDKNLQALVHLASNEITGRAASNMTGKILDAVNTTVNSELKDKQLNKEKSENKEQGTLTSPSQITEAHLNIQTPKNIYEDDLTQLQNKNSLQNMRVDCSPDKVINASLPIQNDKHVVVKKVSYSGSDNFNIRTLNNNGRKIETSNASNLLDMIPENINCSSPEKKQFTKNNITRLANNITKEKSTSNLHMPVDLKQKNLLEKNVPLSKDMHNIFEDIGSNLVNKLNNTFRIANDINKNYSQENKSILNINSSTKIDDTKIITNGSIYVSEKLIAVVDELFNTNKTNKSITKDSLNNINKSNLQNNTQEKISDPSFLNKKDDKYQFFGKKSIGLLTLLTGFFIGNNFKNINIVERYMQIIRKINDHLEEIAVKLENEIKKNSHLSNEYEIANLKIKNLISENFILHDKLLKNRKLYEKQIKQNKTLHEKEKIELLTALENYKNFIENNIIIHLDVNNHDSYLSQIEKEVDDYLQEFSDLVVVPHIFVFNDSTAKTVHLAGNFPGNFWLNATDGKIQADKYKKWCMKKNLQGVWELTVNLQPGEYSFKYVINNGERWETDPKRPQSTDAAKNSIVCVKSISEDYRNVLTI